MPPHLNCWSWPPCLWCWPCWRGRLGARLYSIVTGTLVKAAAEAIGARALLATVAAYYHDIGKTSKPIYFIENQAGGVNRHDKPAPSMSSLILISHRKEGVELAQQYRLGPDLVAILQQHHGTSLIQFFFDKARWLGGTVRQLDYRYPGPKPQTREAALVLLADAVEAASRASCRVFTASASTTPCRPIKKTRTTETMEIWIRNDLPEAGLDEDLLRRRTEKLLSALDCERAELSLWLCDDATIATLHQEYMGREGPTNVLSFAQHEGEFGAVEPDLLGDVAVSLDTARRDAAEVGHGLDAEVAFLVIHGVLHLLGFDHEGAEAHRAAEMEAKEDTLFRTLVAP